MTSHTLHGRRPISAHVDEDDADWFDNLARIKKISRSELLRVIIKHVRSLAEEEAEKEKKHA